MKGRFGLSNQDLSAIIDTLKQEPNVEKAYIFGSRAKGSYKPGSDVDIALKGNQLTIEDISRISYLLNEETNMPYKFDLINYSSIKEPALISHIDRVGIEFYTR